jgi:hypothetical protein
MQGVKACAPYTDQMDVDPFLCDPTTIVSPPLELLISFDLEVFSVFKGIEPFLLLMILTLGSRQHL